MLLDHSLVEIAHDDVQGILSDKSPSSPEIWTELWFQTTIAIIVIVVLALTFVVYRKRYKPKPEELEESEESEDTDVEI
jgi:heme/copper-type cytochrome/quinol oxidase subunit 2